jgi:hypothetical protein
MGDYPLRSDHFVVGTDNFDDLVFNPALRHNLRHIFNKARNSPVKQFVLAQKPQVSYLCQVTIIEKANKFTLRLAFSVRDDTGKLRTRREKSELDTYELKSRVDLEECHENFWRLVSFLQSIQQIEVPQDRFSLLSVPDAEIVSAISRDRDPESRKTIAKELLQQHGGQLSREDINQLLKRRDRLAEFERELTTQRNELWWQNFFEQNKWIFGYGLNYQILRQEQAQAHYGGSRIDRTGGQIGDYLTSTVGDIGFTVLVEIKTPSTALLDGRKPNRSGAWSLSKDLTDALTQIEANIAKWNESFRQLENIDRFEKAEVYTVQPKGIIVIGSLKDVKGERSQRDTFERFRKSIHGVELLTFDELFQRAKYIVDQKE